ncbi:unnamed protein product [Rhizoctonia solani]|uniref:Uncharacterized protein n=1 Tax=Rhizoctonia solani TaxID=456999 RepID=A0A8H3DAI1_9AGAM|nr:unnamed protein product [Rhizoctonia solani]
MCRGVLELERGRILGRYYAFTRENASIFRRQPRDRQRLEPLYCVEDNLYCASSESHVLARTDTRSAKFRSSFTRWRQFCFILACSHCLYLLSRVSPAAFLLRFAVMVSVGRPHVL